MSKVKYEQHLQHPIMIFQKCVCVCGWGGGDGE